MVAEVSVKLAILLGGGFVLGLKHALDADHVVAVSTIVSQTRTVKKSVFAGVMWGIGHTLALLAAGLLVLTLKLKIPDRLALGFEFLVGVVLVILGLDLFRKLFRGQIHIHKHEHDGLQHSHLHSHEQIATHDHTHRSLIVGLFHGLAGSAAVMLFALATVNSTIQGIFFIIIFGFGSILGMMGVSLFIGLPFVITDQFTRVNLIVKILAGSASILLGVFTMYEIGFVKGLLV